MITKKGWNQQLMMSLFKKEPSYGGAVTVNSTNFCTLKGYSDYDPDWADKIQNDKDTVSGAEHGTDQEILSKGFKFSYSEPAAHPNSLIGLTALVMGAHTSTQDGVTGAWKHRITPVAVGTATPSIPVIGSKGGLQYLHKGVKGASIEYKFEEGKPLSFTVELVGSGDRTVNADAFASKISESWMLVKNCKVWLENAANISIAGTLTQGAENISSATPDVLSPRMKSATVKFTVPLDEQGGFGGGDALQDIDYIRRSVSLAVTLRYNDATEVAYYEAQDALAIEFNLKGSIIPGGGTTYFGADITIPRFKLTKAPLPKGGVGDLLTCSYECDVEDDGTNPAIIVEGYNAVAAYLA